MGFSFFEGFKYGWKRWWWSDSFDDLWFSRICSIKSLLEENLALHVMQWKIEGWWLEDIWRVVWQYKHPGIVHVVEYECCWEAK